MWPFGRLNIAAFGPTGAPSKKILADRQTRLAVAHAIDREKLNQVVNKGYPTLANGPFARGVTGFLEKTDAPGYDLGTAKKAVAALKAKGADTKMRLLTSSGPAAIRQAQLEKAMLEAAGFTVTFEVEEEADLISRVIGGSGTCTCGSHLGRWPRPPTSTGAWVRTCPATAVRRRSAS